MILSREVLQTPARAEKSFKGSEKCRQETKRDPVGENEGKITQSSYSVGRSSLESEAQSPVVRSDRKAGGQGDHSKMCKGKKLVTGIVPWAAPGLRQPHRRREGWRGHRGQAGSHGKQHPVPGSTGHVFYEPWEPGTPSAWGCHITPLPSRAVTASIAP